MGDAGGPASASTRGLAPLAGVSSSWRGSPLLYQWANPSREEASRLFGGSLVLRGSGVRPLAGFAPLGGVRPLLYQWANPSPRRQAACSGVRSSCGGSLALRVVGAGGLLCGGSLLLEGCAPCSANGRTPPRGGKPPVRGIRSPLRGSLALAGRGSLLLEGCAPCSTNGRTPRRGGKPPVRGFVLGWGGQVGWCAGGGRWPAWGGLGLRAGLAPLRGVRPLLCQWANPSPRRQAACPASFLPDQEHLLDRMHNLAFNLSLSPDLLTPRPAPSPGHCPQHATLPAPALTHRAPTTQSPSASSGGHLVHHLSIARARDRSPRAQGHPAATRPPPCAPPEHRPGTRLLTRAQGHPAATRPPPCAPPEHRPGTRPLTPCTRSPSGTRPHHPVAAKTMKLAYLG